MSSLEELSAQHTNAQERVSRLGAALAPMEYQYTAEKMSLINLREDEGMEKNDMAAHKASLEKKKAALSAELEAVSAELDSFSESMIDRFCVYSTAIVNKREAVEAKRLAWIAARESYATAGDEEHELKIKLEFAKTSAAHQSFLDTCERVRARQGGSDKGLLLSLAEDEVKAARVYRDRNLELSRIAGDECEQLNTLLENSREHAAALDTEFFLRENQLISLRKECYKIRSSLLIGKEKEKEEADETLRVNTGAISKIEEHLEANRDDFENTQKLIRRAESSLVRAKEVLNSYYEKQDPLEKKYREAMRKLEDIQA